MTTTILPHDHKTSARAENTLALAIHEGHRDQEPLLTEMTANPWANDPDWAIAQRARIATINGYAIACAWIGVRLGEISGAEEIAAYRIAYKAAITEVA
jgi:hypothetical protein